MTGPSPPGILDDFQRAMVTIDGRQWTVAVAADGTGRARGLMGVTDLGDLDGMLFVFETSDNHSFWMRDTLLPLDVAFFDAAGALVDVLQMEPCVMADCPLYSPDEPFLYAVESRQGDLVDLAPDAVLDPNF